MKHIRITAAIILAFLVSLTLYSQNEDAKKILVRGAFHNGQTLLRWVPADISTWLQGNSFGYKVTRQLQMKNGLPVTNAERVASSQEFAGPYLPLSILAWDVFSDTNDIAAVAAGAIYAEDFEIDPMHGTDELYEMISTNEKNENRFNFGLFAADQAFWVAQHMGLAMIDDQVPQNSSEVYVYFVTLLDPDTTNRPSGYGRVEVDVPLALPAIEGLQATNGKGVAMLALPRGSLEEHYTSFIIERSENGGGTWEQRNDKALLFLSNDEDSYYMLFSDTMETVGQSYQYRMRGKSPFGLTGPPSNVATAVCLAEALGVYPRISNVVTEDVVFHINWEFPEENNADILGFQVLRSGNAEADFELLPGGEVPAEERSFTDNAPNPLANYYKIVAIDNNSLPNESYPKLAQLDDTEPPLAPTGLQATVNTDGLVKLTWDANSEPDIKGYRVFFSNSPDDEYAQITGAVQSATQFSHQLDLKVLAKKVYYRILATDFRENDSPYSPVLEVDRPDVLPPAKPVLTKAEPMPIGVVLEWVASSSEDVQRHELQRKPLSAPNWEILETFIAGSSSDTMFIDSTTRGIEPFVYRMLAFDEGGLVSSSTIVEVKPLRTELDTIEKFKINSALDGFQKQAKLSWEYPMVAPVREFHVYRGLDGAQPRYYATLLVDPEELAVDPMTKRAVFIYKDKDISSDPQYHYQVLAKYPDGNSSPLSKKVPFQY